MPSGERADRLHVGHRPDLIVCGHSAEQIDAAGKDLLNHFQSGRSGVIDRDEIQADPAIALSPPQCGEKCWVLHYSSGDPGNPPRDSRDRILDGKPER